MLSALWLLECLFHSRKNSRPNVIDDISRCHRTLTASSTIFMIYDAIIRRNLLVGRDCFYHLYFLLEIYFLLEHGGSCLPFVGGGSCMLRCGDVHRKTQGLGLLTCGLERDRQTPTLKGFTTDFLVEGDEILFVGRYQTHTHTYTKSEWEDKEKRETQFVLWKVCHISQSGGIGKGLGAVLYPFASNIQITSLKWTSTKISLLFQEREDSTFFIVKRY
jgi:hypothetical protein